jgi:pyroglutamyl-peptidase
MTRVLITGFGPFPGAPSNPTMSIATRLGKLRRVRWQRVTRQVRLLPTTWAMLETIPALVAEMRPDVILMFGLAGRRRRITPERRAINQASVLRTDAAGRKPSSPVLACAQCFTLRSSIDPVRMTATLRRQRLPAEVSNSAGDYLCNALLWHALSTGIPAIFVHVPRPRRRGRPIAPSKHPRPSMEDLHRAAEVMLNEVLRRR